MSLNVLNDFLPFIKDVHSLIDFLSTIGLFDDACPNIVLIEAPRRSGKSSFLCKVAKILSDSGYETFNCAPSLWMRDYLNTSSSVQWDIPARARGERLDFIIMDEPTEIICNILQDVYSHYGMFGIYTPEHGNSISMSSEKVKIYSIDDLAKLFKTFSLPNELFEVV